MPTLSRTFDSLHLTFDRIKHFVNCQLSSVKCGFTLLETVLSLFLFLALITILLSASGTYVSTRGSNLQGIASEIALKQIETLRKTDYASLPASGSFTDSDLSKLPQGTATRTLSNYGSPPDPDIKQATIQINWVLNNAARQFKMETLIYKNGL